MIKAGGDLIEGHAQRHCYSGDLDKVTRIGEKFGASAISGEEVVARLSSSKRDYGSEGDGGGC